MSGHLVSKSAEMEKPLPQHCLVSGPLVQLLSVAFGDAEDDAALSVLLVAETIVDLVNLVIELADV